MNTLSDEGSTRERGALTIVEFLGGLSNFAGCAVIGQHANRVTGPAPDEFDYNFGNTDSAMCCVRR
jgi:hypothetical protein